MLNNSYCDRNRMGEGVKTQSQVTVLVLSLVSNIPGPIVHPIMSSLISSELYIFSIWPLVAGDGHVNLTETSVGKFGVS